MKRLEAQDRDEVRGENDPGARIAKICTWTIRVGIALGGLYAILLGDWFLLGTASVSFAASFIVHVLRLLVPPRLPAYFDTAAAALASTHLVGHVFHLYARWGGYDFGLHLLSGAALGFGAFYILRRTAETARFPIGVAALFAVAIAVLVGVVWEIGEFVVDSLLGTENQAGNLDTMMDVMMDAAGATLAAGGAALHEAASDAPSARGFRAQE